MANILASITWEDSLALGILVGAMLAVVALLIHGRKP